MNELAPTLARLSALLGDRDGPPEPLAGGITNRNFKVSFGGVAYVLRTPGKNTDLLGIDRDAEWAAAGAAARTGVGPELGAMLGDPPCLVTRFIEGRPVTAADLRLPAMLESFAAALRAIHDSGEWLPAAFSPFRVVESYEATAREHGAQIPADYGPARERAAAIEVVLTGPEHEPVPCHNDLLPANLIHDGRAIRMIDWEYAGMGDRYFDLGNFAVNNQLDEAGERALLEAYFGTPFGARRHAALRLMRFMSDFREAMWGVVQSAVSELEFDFGDYGRRHFRRLAETAADPHFDRWLEEARGAHA